MQTTQLTNEQEEVIKEELSILVLLEGLDIRDSIFKRIIVYSNLLNKLGISTYRNYTKDLDEIIKEVQGDN